MRVTHSFVSAKADGADATLIQPSNWNDDHVVVDSSGILISADYDFDAQTPGVNLTAGITNSITLSPVPEGVNGTNVHHRLYISGGTGAAEAVLITGGTAVSGAASGTITFIPANNHSGSWTIKSATSGIQEAIYLHATGSFIYIPVGEWPIYGSIAIGDGDSDVNSFTTQSTYNAIRIHGAGATRDWTTPCPTKLKWQGAAGSDMIVFHGPICHCELAHMAIDGNNLAGNIIHSYYGDQGSLHDLLLGNSQAGAYFAIRGEYGFGDNVLRNIFIVQQQSGTSCVAMHYQPGTNVGCSQNTLEHVKGVFPADTSTSFGIVLGPADNNQFLMCDMQGAILTVTGATNASPIVITANQAIPGIATGQKVTIAGVGGNTAANNTPSNPQWTITKISTTQFSLQGSSGNGAYTSGGSISGPGYALAFNTKAGTLFPFENVFVGGAYFNALIYDDNAGHGGNQMIGIGTGDGFLIPADTNFTGLLHPDYYINPDIGSGGPVYNRLAGYLKFVDNTGINGYAKFYRDDRSVTFGDGLENRGAITDVTLVKSAADADLNIFTEVSGDAKLNLKTANGNTYTIASDQTNTYLKITNDAGDVLFIQPSSLVPIFASDIRIGGASGPVIHSGTDAPNSNVTGSVGDLYLRKDGGANTTLYVKESGSATNTGWVAK